MEHLLALLGAAMVIVAVGYFNRPAGAVVLGLFGCAVVWWALWGPSGPAA